MKTRLFLLMILAFMVAFQGQSQTQLHAGVPVYEYNGNLGVGSSTPSHLLSVGLDNSLVASWASALFKQGVAVGNSGQSTATYLLNASQNGVHGLNAFDYGTNEYIPVYLGWGGNNVLLAKDGGFVGVGTVNPTSPLEVKSDRNRMLRLDYLASVNGSYTWQSLNVNSTEQWRIVGRNNTEANLEVWNGNGQSVLTLLQSGNTGLGTNAPSHLLSVGMDNSNIYDNMSAVIKQGLAIGNEGQSTATYLFNASEHGVHGMNAFNYATEEYIPVYVGWGGGNVFLAKDGGNVGIGTVTPSNELEVNGTIRSKKVKVEASPWPDYVFSDDYELRGLEELESFIQQNGHLPEVPSEQEVKKTGQDLGQVQAVLLKKIEELTLYLIEEQKQRKKLENENFKLKTRLDEIEKLVKTLKQ